MTDKEIVKALRICASAKDCSECPMDDADEDECCQRELWEQAADAIERLTAEVERLTRERDAAVRDWQQAAEGSGSFDSCGACTHCKYDNTDGIYCDIKACHPEWRGPEPGGEGKS